MKSITVKTVDLDGNTIEESKLQVEEGDTLLAQYVNEEISVEQMSSLHKFICDAVEGKLKVLTLPKGIEFKVISIN